MRDLKQVATATSSTAVVDAEVCRILRYRSPPSFNFKQAAPKQCLRGSPAHLLSLLVKRMEDVITGKPEASNTFSIK